MSEEWKLTFNKDNVNISKIIERLSDKQVTDIDVETIGYDKIKNINMSVTRIEPNSGNNDVFKSLTFYVSEFKFIYTLDIQPELAFGSLLIIGDERIHCNKANDVLKYTVNWLFKSGRIQKKDLPTYVLKGGRYLLSTTPYHSSGRKFDGTPYKIPNQDAYLNTNFSAIDCRKQSEYLMMKFAPDVKFEIMVSEN
jgi:hypothetical protein